jgi:hypothetical protein
MSEKATRDYDADDMPAHGPSPLGKDGQPHNPSGPQRSSDHRRREREAREVLAHHHEHEHAKW